MSPIAATSSSKHLMASSEGETVSFLVEEYNTLLLKAVELSEWNEVIKQAQFILKNFPQTSLSQEAFYFLACAYFELQEFDTANSYLTSYLGKSTPLPHFREAIHLKFEIAEKFREGHLQRIGGISFFPKWAEATEEAIHIYEEVISAFPHDEIAAQAFLGKGYLLLRQGSYAASIEAYETIIQRFPRHPLVPVAYVDIMHVYLTQAKVQYPNQNDLDLAELQLKRFNHDFPLDPRKEALEACFLQIQEVFANHFYDLAQFYERMKKPGASILYYMKIVKAFPHTPTARRCEQRLKVLQPQELP
ncbi:MAG: outer membrane protein assembly factor BamD [Candidatus Rhabdochlamydia sp.]